MVIQMKGKRKSQDQTTLIIIIILVAVIAAWAIYQRQVAAQNVIGISVDLLYEDGTTETIDPTRLNILSGRSLTITTPLGQNVQEARFKLKGKVDWDASISSWRWTGWLRIYTDESFSDEIKLTSPTIAKNMYKQLAEIRAPKTRLEGWCGSEGAHFIKIEGEAQCTITFADGSTDSKSGITSVTWKITYTKDAPEVIGGQITSFKISTYVTPIT